MTRNSFICCLCLILLSISCACYHVPKDAYSTSAWVADNAPNPSYIEPIQELDRSYELYAHSYLGFGNDYFRFLATRATGTSRPNPCFSGGNGTIYNFTNPSDGQKSQYIPAEKADFAKCSRLILDVLNIKAPCEAPQVRLTRGMNVLELDLALHTNSTLSSWQNS